ncbi:hypothetical protein [Streptomyces nigrescens]
MADANAGGEDDALFGRPAREEVIGATELAGRKSIRVVAQHPLNRLSA